MKLLGLHGLSQNGEVFEKHLSDFLPNNCETSCPDSLLQLDEVNKQLTWWRFDTKNNSFLHTLLMIASEDPHHTFGLNKNIENIAEHWNKEKYDGIVAFSQGTVLATILAKHVDAKFVILISGFCDPWPKQFKKEILDIPSLHIRGKKDVFVPPIRSERLASLYANNIIHEHNYGHIVPTDNETLLIVKEFLNKFS